MGKNDGQLWDDSALIDAFEDAVSSYKMMHKMKQIDVLKEDDKAGDGSMEETIDGETKSHIEMVSTSDIDASNSEIQAISLMEEKKVDEDVSNGKAEQEAVEGYSNAQPDADYHLLVSHYYELQEKLLSTWEQLQQFGNMSDQWPNNTAEVGLSDGAGKGEASGVPSDAPHAASQPHSVCCCCPCTEECMVYSSCPENVCKLCPGTGSEKLPCGEDSEITRMVMRAAEKAISSIKIQTSGQQEGEPKFFSRNGKVSLENKDKDSVDDGCETDISTVLNAWFSAGLATGKYLTEQSNSRRKTDST
ncbi:unnamed protein product [Rhodiola kirilowii]